jgi:hypothetical protein
MRAIAPVVGIAGVRLVEVELGDRRVRSRQSPDSPCACSSSSSATSTPRDQEQQEA